MERDRGGGQITGGSVCRSFACDTFSVRLVPFKKIMERRNLLTWNLLLLIIVWLNTLDYFRGKENCTVISNLSSLQ